MSKAAPSPDIFVTDQVHFKSKDGTQIPMFIVRKKSVLPDVNVRPEKPIPVFLYAYGGFGIVKTPQYSNAHMIWMNNFNGIFAQVGIRGGGEFGEAWHQAASLEKKQTGFDDFIGAAEYLQKTGITEPRLTAINGGSNGGMVMSAVTN